MERKTFYSLDPETNETIQIEAVKDLYGGWKSDCFKCGSKETMTIHEDSDFCYCSKCEVIAKKINQNLSPMGEVLPKTESQSRPLTKLEPEQQKAVVQKSSKPPIEEMGVSPSPTPLKQDTPVETSRIESDDPLRGASPQAEDGHIDIANEIAEVLARINFCPYESRILWVIWRKTYGWHKKMDRISFTQFEKSTGLHRRHIQRTLKHLEERKIIIASKGYGKNATYGFQKDYTKWKSVAYKGYDDGKIRFNKQAKVDGSLPTEAILPTEATDRSLQRLTQKKLTKETYVEDSPELRLATLLLEEIKKNKANFKEPNLQTWARDIDLMLRRDKRSAEAIERVIRWAQSDHGDGMGRWKGWASNILSAGTLREKFDQLELKMNQNSSTEKKKSW